MMMAIQLFLRYFSQGGQIDTPTLPPSYDALIDKNSRFGWCGRVLFGLKPGEKVNNQLKFG